MQSAVVLCRFLHFAVVLSLFGTCLLRPWLIGNTLHAALDRGLLGIKRWLALLALLSAGGWLLLTTTNMTGDWSDALSPATLQLVLGKTFFGQVWSWHLGLCLLLLISLLANARPACNLLLGLLLLATLAPVGHGAMLDGLDGRLLMLNQFVHLSAVGAWLGGLLLLLRVLAQPAGHDLERLLRRFSSLGYALVAMIILSGLVNVRMLTGAPWPTPLFSGFALILLIKVLMVALMLALALFNLVMSRRGRFSVLRSSVTVEWLLGLGAILAVSLLGTLPPMLMN
ncbi:copper homeostasis membrane protein CopD [Pseudomonas sp. FEN]|uniref:copper homeostasis membrane protein CopD n=1 Tax=Pseudomonas sp. FEN TaxID=2767468 RepID=UPI00174CCA4E|nr:copper homeostasis membrane protein CopD [Pseudomonas sp. FEN]CAD5197923.1 Copper resistance protein CopD [Pseudomonas sp. FEN]